VRGLGHVTYFSNIARTAEDAKLKFSREIDRKGYQTTNWNMGQKGAWPRSRDLLFKYWDPSNISGMADDANLTFCIQIDCKGY